MVGTPKEVVMREKLHMKVCPICGDSRLIARQRIVLEDNYGNTKHNNPIYNNNSKAHSDIEKVRVVGSEATILKTLTEYNHRE